MKAHASGGTSWKVVCNFFPSLTLYCAAPDNYQISFLHTLSELPVGQARPTDAYIANLYECLVEKSEKERDPDFQHDLHQRLMKQARIAAPILRRNLLIYS